MDTVEQVDSNQICPECGRSFGRPAALGAHRRRAHGVIGARAYARAQREGRSATHDVVVDRDALLKALFPYGMPARAELLRDVNEWLDEAERLARGS